MTATRWGCDQWKHQIWIACKILPQFDVIPGLICFYEDDLHPNAGPLELVGRLSSNSLSQVVTHPSTLLYCIDHFCSVLAVTPEEDMYICWLIKR